MRWSRVALIWLVGLLWLVWWLRFNPLPDGYQNEFLHLGNALDLFDAVWKGAFWQVKLLIEGNYWPPLYAMLAFPFVAIDRVWHHTQGAQWLIASNLLHLAVLLGALRSLGRALDAPLAPLLAALCPGVFGCLVRFEPNLAVIAWTAAGLALLVYSDGLRRRGAVIGWGLCLAGGLLMDRLSIGFFLVPAVLPLLYKADRRGWQNLGIAVAIAAALTLPWYVFFFATSASEILGQAPVGEIDSAGQLTATPGPLAWAYYPLVLVDSQAGPVLGLVMVAGMVGSLRRERLVLLASVLAPVIFFTFIAKKQIYYTLPILGPLAVLAASSRRLAWLGVAGGAWSFLAVGVGLVRGGPWLPEAWVSPRHVIARPPSFQEYPLDEAVAALGPDPRQVLVFSEDETLFEGFAVLAARERWPRAEARGVTLDPQGTFERLGEVDSFLWITPNAGAWPSSAAVREQLENDHYDLTQLPRVDLAVSGVSQRFYEAKRLRTEDLDLVVFVRR